MKSIMQKIKELNNLLDDDAEIELSESDENTINDLISKLSYLV